MPLIKSAKKQMRQNVKHRVRNYRVREDLKISLKNVLDVARHDKKEDAEKALQLAYKAIDTASKKNIIHPNNADRKKSHMARLIADMAQKKAEVVVTKGKGAAKKAVKVAKVKEPVEEVVEEAVVEDSKE